MPKRIAITTGGGDAPGLNAVIRAVVKSASLRGWECLGIADGFDGLLRNDGSGVKPLTTDSVRGILPRGGTILGTSNRGSPFAYRVETSGEVRVVDRSQDAMQRLRRMGVDVLVMIGGDGTLRIGLELSQIGMPVVGVPKTIDNDLEATEVTFGFDTALTTACEAIDKLHTTAESHHRVMVLEVMGRHAGWIAIASGIAGGADIILIPEIPFTLESVVKHLQMRHALGHAFSIVVVAEGAMPKGGAEIYQPRQPSDPVAPKRLGGVGNWLADELTGRIPHEIRTTVLGHLQRGGSPSARDRILASRFGVRAVELIEEGVLNHMVALQNDCVVAVPLAEAISRAKLVPADGELVRTARSLFISFGDDGALSA